MAIGANWKDVWQPVWGNVWTQEPPDSTPGVVIGINWQAIWKPVWKQIWTLTAPSPTPTPSPAPPGPVSGGFFFGFDRYRSERDRRRREQEEREREAEAIEDETTRQIAELLRAQEAKDAKRADLERLQALADRYAGEPLGLPARTRAALYNAYETRTLNALEQMQREIERMLEEEEAAISAILMLDD